MLSGKRQGKHELGKQKQEMEGLEHLQTCSDVPAPWTCRGYNNAALYGVEVPPWDVHPQVGKNQTEVQFRAYLGSQSLRMLPHV
mgnify:CR=1 FL=1